MNEYQSGPNDMVVEVVLVGRFKEVGWVGDKADEGLFEMIINRRGGVSKSGHNLRPLTSVDLQISSQGGEEAREVALTFDGKEWLDGRLEIGLHVGDKCR